MTTVTDVRARATIRTGGGPLSGNPMNENRLELTRDQQELLLQGLRFVRSSVALDMRDYTVEYDAERRRQYDRINTLETLLKSAPLVETASA